MNMSNRILGIMKLEEIKGWIARLSLPEWVLWLNVGLFPVLITFFVLIEYAPKPPVADLERAAISLSKARNAESSTYASELLKDAELCWEKALAAWRSENKKFPLSRDFKLVRYFAESSMLMAQQSMNKSKASKASLKQIAASQISILKNQVDEFQEQYAHLPVDNLSRKECAKGELKLKESEMAFARGDYKRAAAKAREAGYFINNSGSNVARDMKDYFNNVPKWQRWVKETIAWTEQSDSIAIIVDKMAHVCQVYQDGRMVAEYPVELGAQWLGPKLQRGDKATPEGHYRITKKKGPDISTYYKALEIDYPNLADIANFNLAKRNGDVSPSAHIGGLIEIHGEGGKGANWTSGCVALANSHMDEIYDLACIGTPVTIVGSQKAVSVGSDSRMSLKNSFTNTAAIRPSYRVN